MVDRQIDSARIDDDVDFSLTQLKVQVSRQSFFALESLRRRQIGFNVEVNIPTAFAIVYSGFKQTCRNAKALQAGLADDLFVGWGSGAWLDFGRTESALKACAASGGKRLMNLWRR